MNENSDSHKSARQDWLPSLMVGLLAVLVCPMVDSLTGGAVVASHSVRLGLAGAGALSLMHAAFGARGAPKRAKLTCGSWIAFGALFAVLDFVVAVNT